MGGFLNFRPEIGSASAEGSNGRKRYAGQGSHPFTADVRERPRVPVQGSYRPNHNFFGCDNREMATGFINFAEGEFLQPGESVDVEMTFWGWSRLAGEIYPGREWLIQEGPRVVGSGTILEVLD
jgi:translation elongation factor EF-Tu-like GTPase